jgi:hypothetical protein
MEGTLKTEGEIRFELPNGTGGVSRMRLMEANKDPDGNGGNSFQFTSHPSHTGTLSNAKSILILAILKQMVLKLNLGF